MSRQVEEFVEPFRQLAGELRDSARNGPVAPLKHAASLPIIDPVRFRRILVNILKLLIVLELVGALVEGVSNGKWGRFGADLIVAGVLWVAWDRIMTLVRERKMQARERMLSGGEGLSLWDALVFSLLWTDEIYMDIPADRRRLIVISYTLIALGLLAAFLKIGTGLMPLVVSGALVLGAVNLVSWIVSVEREEKESLRTELKIAHDVQTSMMPRHHPTVAGLDIAGMSEPAKEVGGDLFDYVRLGGPEGTFAVSVSDVSGKGLQAAMSAVYLSGALASECRQSTSPAEILTRLNRSVCSHARRGHFVAFLLAAFNPFSRTLVFANAGQTKPLLLSGERLEWLDTVGVRFPLGMREDCVYQERTCRLAPGDVVVLTSDGLADAMNGAKELFGQERIESVVRSVSRDGVRAEDLLRALNSTVREHMGDTPQHDDMTMVVVRVP